jgi:hypothetical protein
MKETIMGAGTLGSRRRGDINTRLFGETFPLPDPHLLQDFKPFTPHIYLPRLSPSVPLAKQSTAPPITWLRTSAELRINLLRLLLTIAAHHY